MSETLSGAIAELAARDGSAVALVSPDEHLESTYADLAAQARAFAYVLDSRDIQSADRFAIKMRNQAAYVTCLLGAWRIGAAVVPVDPMLKGPDARDLIKASGATALAIDAGGLVELHGLRAECSTLRATFVAGSEPIEDGCIALDAALAAAADVHRPQLLNVAGDTVATESYRAHTDGFEPVRCTHADLLGHAHGVASEFRLNDTDKGVVAIQLGHRDGVAALAAALTSGGRCIIPERFNARAFWEMAAAQRATWLALVPTQFYDLSFSGPPPNGAHEVVRGVAVAGSSIPANARDEFTRKFGIQVRAMRPS